MDKLLQMALFLSQQKAVKGEILKLSMKVLQASQTWLNASLC